MNPPTTTRRQFIQTSLAAGATLAAPTILTASRTGNRPIILGQNDYQFEYLHDWAQLPDQYTWQTTHNVAVDSSGLVYVIHEGRADQTDHPSIFVFDSEGVFVRAFGNQFQGGGHGIEVRKEGSDEFLYIAAYQQVKSFAKLTLTGETIWEKYAPMDSGVYARDEDKVRTKAWGRDRFMPTNFAFLPFDETHKGDFFLADGYGSFYIHRYDKDGNWKSHFGGPTVEGRDNNGKFDTPHGLWIDDRDDVLTLVVTDRANHRLQVLSLEGEHWETIEGFGLPANIDVQKEAMLVAELLGRISIVDKHFSPLATLGDDRSRIEDDGQFAIRKDETQWNDGKFVHPHDACFDAEGNIYVAEWVHSGRVSKLKKTS